MSAIFAICTIEIFIPDALSLKDKRQILKSLLERIRNRTNASVAETACNDLWQRAQISVALVTSEKNIAEKQFALIQKILDDNSQVETTDFSYEYI